MKADYMQYIFECLVGDDGCLKHDQDEKSFYNKYLERESKEISEVEYDEEMSDVWFKLNKKFAFDSTEVKDAKQKLKHVYSKTMTLLEFMEHETMIEYERAIRSLFSISQNDRELKSLKQSSTNTLSKAPFHQVVLSSLLNQAVFMHETLNHKKAIDMAKTRVKLDEGREREITEV